MFQNVLGDIPPTVAAASASTQVTGSSVSGVIAYSRRKGVDYQMGGVLGYQGQMRGYGAGSIGYRRVGRSYQYIGAELTWPIAPNRFYLLPLFFDAGNVFGPRYEDDVAVSKDLGSPLKDWDPSNLKRDFGFGFRVIVPMLGVIGFDFAWPLDPGETYSGFDKTEVGAMEFNFIIGQSF